MAINALNNMLVKKLFSTNSFEVIQALDEIEHSGNSLYIASLVELLYSHNNAEIIEKTRKLLSEIKHPDSVLSLMESIKNPRYEKIRETILNCCWQNGLNYSEYISDIIDLLLDKDYMVAFEAYTIIMNIEEYIESEKANLISDLLKNEIANHDKNRQELINDVINYISTISK